MVEADIVKDPEFKWGKKSGIGKGGMKGGKVIFYESFTYDGVEYARFDCVYLYKEGEPEPYIGKLLKMWEHPDKKKRVKVLWFFRPCEILNFIGGVKPSDNELFLASGEGTGLCNVNPLEAIAGKCNVVCLSKDDRNRQPTCEELHMADFVFCRTFDVGKREIMDKLEEKIAETDVKLLLNKKDFKESSGTLKVDSRGKEVGENAVQNDARVVTSEQNISTDYAALNTNGHCINTSGNEAAELLIQKALSRSKVESKNSEGKDGKVIVRQVEREGKVECATDSVELEHKPTKKAKLSSESAEKSKNSMQQPGFNSDATEVPTASSLKRSTDYTEEGPSKKLKPSDKTRLSNGKLIEETSQKSHNEDHKTDGQELEVTPRPQADRRKWFTGLPWEDQLRDAYKEGTLVLLQNLDPSYTSAEVEDIVWHGFKVKCTAKMIQQTVFSSPHSGQAFVILKKKETAEMVVGRLEESCLLLSNGRPLVGSFGVPYFPEKKPTFFGHFVIDKLRYQMQRQQRDAVSTSHCSQPNTLEFDMAMEWCLRQEKSDLMWKKLYQMQGQELKKLKAKLKSRRTLML